MLPESSPPAPHAPRVARPAAKKSGFPGWGDRAQTHPAGPRGLAHQALPADGDAQRTRVGARRAPRQQGHPASPRRRPAPRGGSSWGRRRLRAVLPPARGGSPRAGAWAAGRAPAVLGPEGGWAARPAGVLTPSDPGRDGELCLFRLFLKLTARIRLIYLRCTSRPRIYFMMFLRVTRSRPPPPCLPRPGARPPSLCAALPSKDAGWGGRQAWRGCPAAPLAAGVVPRCRGAGRAPGGPVSSGQGLFTGRGPSQGADSGPRGGHCHLPSAPPG